MASHVISNWNPEDKTSWDRSGHGVAQRNLWLSIPALTLAFAVWMVIGLTLYFAYGYKNSVLRRGKAPVSPE